MRDLAKKIGKVEFNEQMLAFLIKKLAVERRKLKEY
jgi:hypothetical protein